MAQTLEAIRFKRGDLQILDQLKLPHESTYVVIRDSKDGFQAIKDMVVRGAPAIAIVAALSLAVELQCKKSQDEITPTKAREFVHSKLDYLLKSRPTAVNLADASRKLKEVVSSEAITGEEVFERYVQAAEQMLIDDVQDNKNIGDFGARWILENATRADEKIKVLTHCNTGFVYSAFVWVNT
jgi:methylthioribose-1-phosphate isomerase